MNKDENTKVNGHSFSLNLLICHKLWIENEVTFRNKLMNLRSDLGFPKLKEIHNAMEITGDIPNQGNWNKLVSLVESCRVNRENVVSQLSKAGRKYVFDIIEEVRLSNNLGQEWRQSLLDIVINGFIMPPIYNLVIRTDKTDKTIYIGINSSTSLNDIKDAWGAIEDAKTNMFGKTFRRNMTKKSVDNLIETAKQLEIMRKNPNMKTPGIIGELRDQQRMEMDGEIERKAASKLRKRLSRLKRKL